MNASRISRWGSTALGAGALVVLGAATYVSGCTPSSSSDTGSDDKGPPPGAGGAGASGGQTGGAAGAGGVDGAGGSVGQAGFDFGGAPPATGGGGGSLTPDAGCAAQSFAGEAIEEQIEIPIYDYSPVAIYLMQDRSSSMVGVAGDPQRWPDATNAVSAFVNDPNSKDLIVGLGFFPGYPGDGNACDGTGCPKYVEFGALPANAPNITNAYGQATPPVIPIFTPTECALRGAVGECAQYQTDHQIPCVVVLVTDGEPTQCNLDGAFLAGIAAEAYNSWSVRTYTLGMAGANFALLDQIATAGGTDCDPNSAASACNVAAGPAAFLDALNTIRAKVQVGTQVGTQTVVTQVECEWGLPPVPDGETFDKTKVNVQYQTAATGPDPVQVGKVPSEAECGAYGDVGWFFDSEDNPTRVAVCPNTCFTVQSSPDVTVDVVLGCETVPATIQ